MECLIVATTSLSTEKYLCGFLSLYWTTWQVRRVNCFYQCTFEYHSGSQLIGNEDTASSQSQSEGRMEARGVLQVFSRGGNAMFGKKSSFPLFLGKCFGVMQTGYWSPILAWSHSQFRSSLMLGFNILYIQNFPWHNWKQLPLLEIDVVLFLPCSPFSNLNI